jgi:hypothetical protein
MKRRRRERPQHSWDRLRGTRLEVAQLEGGEVRRLCVDVADPLPAVVSFGVHAFTQPANGPVLRAVAVDNWNDDNRELFQIPEARAWFGTLWHKGKRLLRLLTESTSDTPPDDRLGIPQHEVSQLGLGWWDVYVLGVCEVEAAAYDAHAPGGPEWGIAAVAPDHRTRDDVRAELLQMSPENPEGYTFDDATARNIFTANNMPDATEAARAVPGTDTAVLVLSLLDPVALKLAHLVADAAAIQRVLADSKPRDLHPAAIVAVDRRAVAEAVEPFAPDAAKIMAKGRPETGWHWAVFVAHNGTTLARVNGTEGNK